MNYPYQSARIYVNPNGNLAASGYYRSSVTQELANMMPPCMHMRENPRSIGQQFLSAPAMALKNLEQEFNNEIRNKFITTARVDEVDVLYRVKIPNNVNLTNADASGIRCVAAPSGCSPSGISQIWVNEISNLEEFYYNVLPTRIEVTSSGDYSSQVDGTAWHSKPSGIPDTEENWVDIWGKKHDISWCYDNHHFRKQDVETMEDYETYPDAEGTMGSYPSNIFQRIAWVIQRTANSQERGYGVALDMDFYKGILWWIGKESIGVGSPIYYLNLSSTKTDVPQDTHLDHLASFNITSAFELEPSGIIVTDEGTIRICDTNKTRVFEVNPRYDYFIVDKDNRYLYFKEDYRDSGVFVSNT